MIAAIISYVNDKKPGSEFIGTKLGVIMTKPRAAAAKLVDRPERTLRSDLLPKNFLIKNTLLILEISVNIV